MRDDVELRNVIAADLPLFFAHQADPEAYRMTAFTPRDWNAFSAHWAKILANPSVTNRTILCAGQVVGNIACWAEPEERLVGYWIDKQLGTLPVFLLVGFLVGAGSGTVMIAKLINRFLKETDPPAS